MMKIEFSANDIEQAINGLHKLATTGTNTEARHAAEFLLGLYDGARYPMNLTDFASFSREYMKSAIKLQAFLLTTRTPLATYMSQQSIAEVEAALREIAPAKAEGAREMRGKTLANAYEELTAHYENAVSQLESAQQLASTQGNQYAQTLGWLNDIRRAAGHGLGTSHKELCMVIADNRRRAMLAKAEASAH
jgi:hypothetical protein